MKTRGLVQTHDGHLAPVIAPTAWAGVGAKEGSILARGRWQLLILAQGAYSILSHAIVAIRRAIFWQDTWGLLLFLFQALPGSLNCK